MINKNEDIWVTDFELSFGKVNNCCVWINKRGINLERYMNNPKDILLLGDEFHIQNRYTAIKISKDDVKGIEIRAIKESEW